MNLEPDTLEASWDTLDRAALTSLLAASQAINQGLEVQDVLQATADHAARVLNAEGAAVLVFDNETDELVFEAVSGPAKPDLLGVRMNAVEGIAGQTIKTRRPVSVNDVKLNANFSGKIDDRTQVTTRALAAAPMIYQDEVVGVVETINPNDRAGFSKEDLTLLQVFANLAAGPTHNSAVTTQLRQTNRALGAMTTGPTIAGDSGQIQDVLQICKRVAPTNTTALVTGETGSGKELIAQTIHAHSKRAEGPFVPLHCAALPEALFESELFGHERGAFTGATEQKTGRLELAEGGTLFLDEVGEIPLSIQVKLLRVIQEREYARVGSSQTRACNVRIVAATHRDLAEQVKTGAFREDLYYRLNVMPIRVPPLRERKGDVPILVDFLLEQVAADLGLPTPTVDAEAMARFETHRWPGNIRELRNVLERATLLADGVITAALLPAEVVGATSTPDEEEPAGSILASQEKTLVAKALADHGGNQSAAARALGISRDNLRYRVKKYGL